MRLDRATFLKERKPIVEHCKTPNPGCRKIDGKKYCSVYLDPGIWWRTGHKFAWRCPIATHFEREKMTESQKMLNPIKASKRGGHKVKERPMVPTRKYNRASNHRRFRYYEGS